MASLEAQARKKRTAVADEGGEAAPLNSHEHQEKVINPKADTVKIFGKELKLHPLPAKWSLQFSGFVLRVFGASDQSIGLLPALRIGGVIAERYSEDFLRYLARATSPTNLPVPDQQIDRLVAEMSEKLDADALIPLALAFLRMLDQNKTMKSLGVPETGAKN